MKRGSKYDLVSTDVDDVLDSKSCGCYTTRLCCSCLRFRVPIECQNVFELLESYPS
jgi:hypothetical protein